MSKVQELEAKIAEASKSLQKLMDELKDVKRKLSEPQVRAGSIVVSTWSWNGSTCYDPIIHFIPPDVDDGHKLFVLNDGGSAFNTCRLPGILPDSYVDHRTLTSEEVKKVYEFIVKLGQRDEH